MTVTAGADDSAMAHVLALARMLVDVDDDDRFLVLTGIALGALADVAPADVPVLLDLLAARLDEALGDVSRETRVTSGADVSRETCVTGCTHAGGGGHYGACVKNPNVPA